MTITERPTPQISSLPEYELSSWERKLIGAHLFVAIIALGQTLVIITGGHAAVKHA